MERKKGVMKRRGWALRLIWRDDGRRELGGRMERRGGNNLCWLTSPRWPCRRGHGSLHLPEIISLTHTLTHTITHTHLPQNGKKKGLMIFQHVHTNSQNPSLQFFLQEPGRASMCVRLSHFEDWKWFCVPASVCVLRGCVSCLGHHMFPTNLFSPLKKKSLSICILSSFN